MNVGDSWQAMAAGTQLNRQGALERVKRGWSGMLRVSILAPPTISQAWLDEKQSNEPLASHPPRVRFWQSTLRAHHICYNSTPTLVAPPRAHSHALCPAASSRSCASAHRPRVSSNAATARLCVVCVTF